MDDWHTEKVEKELPMYIVHRMRFSKNKHIGR